METRQQALALHMAIAAIALAAIATQGLIVPQVARGFAEAYPEVAYLAPPYTIVIAIAIGSLEVGLLAAWQLISAARTSKILSSGSRRWANAMAASVALMATLFAGVCAHASFVADVGGPPVFLGLLAALALVPGSVILREVTMGYLQGPVFSSGAASPPR